MSAHPRTDITSRLSPDPLYTAKGFSPGPTKAVRIRRGPISEAEGVMTRLRRSRPSADSNGAGWAMPPVKISIYAFSRRTDPVSKGVEKLADTKILQFTNTHTSVTCATNNFQDYLSNNEDSSTKTHCCNRWDYARNMGDCPVQSDGGTDSDGGFLDRAGRGVVRDRDQLPTATNAYKTSKLTLCIQLHTKRPSVS